MVAFPFRPLRPCDTCLLYWDPPAPRRAYARPHVTALCVITLCKTASCSFGAFAMAPSRVQSPAYRRCLRMQNSIEMACGLSGFVAIPEV